MRHDFERPELDDRAKAKIVELRIVHKLTISTLAQRYRCSVNTIKAVLAEAERKRIAA